MVRMLVLFPRTDVDSLMSAGTDINRMSKEVKGNASSPVLNTSHKYLNQNNRYKCICPYSQIGIDTSPFPKLALIRMGLSPSFEVGWFKLGLGDDLIISPRLYSDFLLNANETSKAETGICTTLGG